MSTLHRAEYLPLSSEHSLVEFLIIFTDKFHNQISSALKQIVLLKGADFQLHFELQPTVIGLADEQFFFFNVHLITLDLSASEHLGHNKC